MKLILNSNAIIHDTGKSLLIKLPNSELKFWHTARFCNTSGKGSYKLSVWFGDENWEIKAERKSDKTYNVLESWTGTLKDAVKKFNLKVEK